MFCDGDHVVADQLTEQEAKKMVEELEACPKHIDRIEITQQRKGEI
jgi:hypothetical protein